MPLNLAGGLLRRLGRMAEAEAALRQAVALSPDSAALLSNWGNVLKDIGDLDGALACFRRAVEADPADAIAHGNLLYTLSFKLDDGKVLLEEGRRWDQRHARSLRPEVRRYANDFSPDRRLRIGYVSGDFRDHCQTLFTVPLLSHHDRSAVEVLGYSSVERPDGFTDRLRSLADGWRDVTALSDAALAERVREDRVDVLIDLEMHMANGRPLLFARQPAPVQIAWLAYPATTGMSAYDAVLTDPRLVPPGSEADYVEPVVRLPDTFWCYDPLTEEPEPNDLPALSNGHVTFGCLNAPCKVTDDAIALWARVLRAVPRSRLIVMAPQSPHRRRIQERFAAAGVAPGSVEFVPFQRRADYLRTYHRIDVALDTFPYNGHTTSLDAAWMGVPVVSRVGRTAVARAGLSQLHHLDLTELAAATDDGFVAAATALATDLPRLSALRADLRFRFDGSPLRDGRRFARGIEAACRSLWRDACRRYAGQNLS